MQLQGVLQNGDGLCFDVAGDLKLDCHVDADFAGLWGYEDDQDPVCIRSCTGYVMTLGECLVHWVSRLQTEIALSTCESEHIALTQAMCDFIPLRQFYDTMLTNMNLKSEGDSLIKSHIF